MTGRAPEPRVTLALAAGTAEWESRALGAVAAAPTRVTLVKRCLDLADLLVVAATGTARVAVVDHRLPGLDGDSLERLGRAGVRTLAVVPDAVPDDERSRLDRLGVDGVVASHSLVDLPTVVVDLARAPEVDAATADRDDDVGTRVDLAGAPTGPRPARSVRALPAPDADPIGSAGRLVAVWGPHGAPGRTTVAIGVAAEAAARGTDTMLVDADPYGGAVGQHLAVLDEASGLLAAVRLANAGQLDAARLAASARSMGERWRVLTGLPRPDRWQEVRPHTLSGVLDVAVTLTDLVVVDAGFGLDPRAVADGRPGHAARDHLSTTTVGRADDVVVVASADPVGLTRLARSLLDLGEVRPAGPDVVVVNRMRPGLGWSERDVVDMVARVAPYAAVRFLPEDRAAADRALVGGRTLLEGPDGPLRREVAGLTSLLLARTRGAGAEAHAVAGRGLRRRAAGRAR